MAKKKGSMSSKKSGAPVEAAAVEQKAETAKKNTAKAVKEETGAAALKETKATAKELPKAKTRQIPYGYWEKEQNPHSKVLKKRTTSKAE